MMMKQTWTDVSEEPISEEGIRALHVPEESYRVDTEEHKAGSAFTVKAGDDFVLYVLSGSCKTTAEGMLTQLNAGEFLFLGKGAYQFKSVGVDDARLVKVMAKN
jgi:glyoxylate utilization-related uncharacterized protein